MIPYDTVTEIPMFLEAWNCTITMQVTSDGIYFPLRQLCVVVGIADAQFQAEELSNRRATKSYMRKLPITTGRGKRQAWSMHIKLFPYWLGTLSDKRVRPELADAIVDFQLELIESAHQLLFAQSATTLTVDSAIIPINRRLGKITSPLTIPDDDE